MINPAVTVGMPAMMIPISGLLLFMGMAVVTFAMGMYLVVTNPPKDESAFVGIGKEKYTDEELATPDNEEPSDTNSG